MTNELNTWIDGTASSERLFSVEAGQEQHSMNLKPIQEQVVAVVGASSGIGRATALQFAKRGAKVVVSGRNEAKLASLVDEIRGFAGEVTPVIADVSVFEQVKAIADKAVETYGRLDT